MATPEELRSEGLAMARARADYKKGHQEAGTGHPGWLRGGQYVMRHDPGVADNSGQLLRQTDGSLVDPDNPDWEDAAEAFRQRLGLEYKTRGGFPETGRGAPIDKSLGTFQDTLFGTPHWARSEESYGLAEDDPERHTRATGVSVWDETLGWLERKAFEQREAESKKSPQDLIRKKVVEAQEGGSITASKQDDSEKQP